MATRVACTAAPRAGFSPTPRMGRERPSRARRGPVRVVAGDLPLDNETIAPSEAETLDAFATRVCQRVGRGEEDARAIARTLRANWFETAEDVASLTVDQLVAMGVPARWGQAMRDLSREETDAARLASGGPPRPAPRPRGRGRDGWIGGALPGPDERLERPTTGRTAQLARDWGSNQIVSAGASGRASARRRARRRSRCRASASRNASGCLRTRCATRRFPRRCVRSWRRCGGTSRRAAWAAAARPCGSRRRRITKRWRAG